MVPLPGAGVPQHRYTCRTRAGTTVVPIASPDSGLMPGFSRTARRSDLTLLVVLGIWCLIWSPWTEAQPPATPEHHSPSEPGPIPGQTAGERCRESGRSGDLETAPYARATKPAQPELMLANVYEPGIDLNAYWVSEKYDGVRAYWNGHQFISRQGNPYPSPDWFVAGFPLVPLDGELWIARNRFEQLVGTVRQQEPDAQAWRQVRYMVFDLPASAKPFGQRLEELRRLLGKLDNPYIRLVPQTRVADQGELRALLDEVVAGGGEGLMLHRDDSLYRAARSDDLLKLKRYEDAEARVVAHLPGSGKYAGMLGSLLVETEDGLRFRIGTGMSDGQRRNPPAVGAIITFTYHGKTRRGVPRFASFLRVREGY